MSTVPITVYLNDCREHAFRDYVPECCALKEAVRYEAMDRGPDRTQILEEAFEAFNIGTEHDPVVARYRAAGCRSLSVGDVVEIAGKKYVCDRWGWMGLVPA